MFPREFKIKIYKIGYRSVLLCRLFAPRVEEMGKGVSNRATQFCYLSPNVDSGFGTALCFAA